MSMIPSDKYIHDTSSWPQLSAMPIQQKRKTDYLSTNVAKIPEPWQAISDFAKSSDEDRRPANLQMTMKDEGRQWSREKVPIMMWLFSVRH